MTSAEHINRVLCGRPLVLYIGWQWGMLRVVDRVMVLAVRCRMSVEMAWRIRSWFSRYAMRHGWRIK